MALNAWALAQKVAKILNDDDNIRCTVDELVMWFNTAQRDIVNMKPDTLTANGTITLVAGTKQSAASVTVGQSSKTGLRLLDVIRNAGTDKRAVAPVKREVLDTIMPDWHNSTPSAVAKRFMFDERDPLTFYVYPPQSATPGSVEVLVSIAPTEVAIADDGNSFHSGDTLSISEIHESNMIDLMLARALSKDSKIIGNMQRAQAHYAAVASRLGVAVQIDKYFAPSDGFSASVSNGSQQ